MRMRSLSLSALVLCGLAGCTNGLGVPVVPPDLSPPPTVNDLAAPGLDLFVAPPRPELCNGVDDDGDGVIDEGCPRPLSAPGESTNTVAVSSGVIVTTTVDGVYVQHGPDGARTLFAANGVEAQVAGNFVYYRIFPADGSHATMYIKGLTGDPSYAIMMPAGDYSFGGASLGAAWFAYSWTLDPSGDNYDVFSLDLATGAQATVVSDNNDSQGPIVDGNAVYYRDEHDHWPEGGWPFLGGGKFDAAVNDLPPGTPRRYLTARTDDTGYMGSFVVNHARLYFTDTGKYVTTTTGTSCVLTRVIASTNATDLLYTLPVPGPCDQIMAASDRWIVAIRWVDPLHQTLRLYDLNTFKNVGANANALDDSRALTTYPTRILQVALSQNLVTWIDYRNGVPNAFAMDLSQVDSGDFHPEGQ